MRIALTYGYSPDVEFCGYSIPHPSEAVLHLRIQTWGELRHLELRRRRTLPNTFTDGVSASEVLRKGLEDLTDLCDVVMDKFTASRDEFNSSHPDGVQSS